MTLARQELSDPRHALLRGQDEYSVTSFEHRADERQRIHQW